MDVTPQALETHRLRLAAFIKRIDAESAEAAKRRQEWQSENPDYQRLWRDERYVALQSKYDPIFRALGERLAALGDWEEMTADQREEAKAIECEQHDTADRARHEVAEIMRDYDLPQREPRNTPERLRRALVEEWNIKRACASVCGGDLHQGAREILEEFTPLVCSMLGLSQPPIPRQSLVLDVQCLIMLLEEALRSKPGGLSASERTKARILDLLHAQGQRMTGKEIASELGVKPNYVKHALQELMDSEDLLNVKGKAGGYGLSAWGAKSPS